MKIQVTQEDIDLGIQSNSTKCAVARAVNRAFKGQYSISVVLYHVSVYPQGAEYYEDDCQLASLRLPMEASEFITLFDQSRESCEPIAFDLPTGDLALAA